MRGLRRLQSCGWVMHCCKRLACSCRPKNCTRRDAFCNCCTDRVTHCAVRHRLRNKWQPTTPGLLPERKANRVESESTQKATRVIRYSAIDTPCAATATRD
jgi:hypothetical protein